MSILEHASLVSALPIALAAISVEQYRGQVRSVLRNDPGAIVLGIVVVAVALAAAAFYEIGARAKDPALFWFACFAPSQEFVP